MIDPNEFIAAAWSYTPPALGAEPLLVRDATFTRSNGTIISRIYERLTKASRRRANDYDFPTEVEEQFYRQGVYDAFKALQEELA